MQNDMRETIVYSEAEELIQLLRSPSSGLIYDAREIHANIQGDQAVFSGVRADRLEGIPPSRICLADLSNGDIRQMTFGPNTDREPKFSPDSLTIAFLSDRHKVGDFQLYMLELDTGAVISTPVVEGWVEYLHWSPDGRHILLGVAGHGADISGGQGAITSRKTEEDIPSWVPRVETGDEEYRWRSAWVYHVDSGVVSQISKSDSNIWEASWCGSNAIAAVASTSPSEASWYAATLNLIDCESGEERKVYLPDDQLGWPSASPTGQHLAIVEAVCSDRWVVAGDLLVIDPRTSEVGRIYTNNVDITQTQWRSEECLFLGGHRGFEIVILEYNIKSKKLTECWVSRQVSTSGLYMKPTPLGDQTGDCLFIGESFTRAPEIGVIKGGEYRSLVSFDHGVGAQVRQWIGSVDAISWIAPDGCAIEGWLIQPKGEAPHPLVMHVHGGPVWHWRPRWWRGAPHFLLLLKRGYAVFWPNPRGSSGRGQAFARHVKGDMGGADTQDYLSGLDYLVAQGICDPERIGVIGVSYGGFMASWLITQDTRFAAGIPVAPVTNQVTLHLLSNIPDFVSLFLDDHYTNHSGKYFERSPIMHAHKVKTPTLNIAGALDRCTPPQEAQQFHNALLENGVESVLVIYPEEGHGVRKMPAAIDFAARVVDWFETHMPSTS